MHDDVVCREASLTGDHAEVMSGSAWLQLDLPIGVRVQ